MALQKTRAIGLLQKAISQIPELKKLHRDSAEFQKWHRNTEVAVGRIFGESGSHVKEFTGINFSLMVITWETPESEWQKAYLSGLSEAESVLQSMLEEIQEYWDDQPESTTPIIAPETASETNTSDVFVVHGRDGGTKELVARFLSKLGLNPIILHEKPNEGRTVIEKFERHSDVGFAVVLLTPDDVGALAEESGRQSGCTGDRRSICRPGASVCACGRRGGDPRSV